VNLPGVTSAGASASHSQAAGQQDGEQPGIRAQLRRVKPLPRALILLAASLCVFLGSNLYFVSDWQAGSAQVVTSYLQRDANGLTGRVTRLKELVAAQDNVPRLTSTPVFIERIGALAAAERVPIHGIRPDVDNPELFVVSLEADYLAFERFIAALEELDVDILSFSAKVDNQSGDDPKATFELQLLPNNDARQLQIPRLRALMARLEEEERRNPFQRLDGSGSLDGNRIDLTDFFSLTGISRIGDYSLVTINGHDYVVGDRLGNREITEILDDRVLLQRQGLTRLERFVLRFPTLAETEGQDEVSAFVANVTPVQRGGDGGDTPSSFVKPFPAD